VHESLFNRSKALEEVFCCWFSMADGVRKPKLEPADWVGAGGAAIGSGGSYALAAARALVDIEGMDAQQIGDASSLASQSQISP
jgi:hypothetical protein